MRGTSIAGIALIVIGGVLLVQGGAFTTRRDVIHIGDLKVSADESHALPVWVSGLAIVAGVGLLVVGVKSKA